MKNEYINPFGGDIGKSELYNLSSGVPLHRSIAESILPVRKVGITKYDESEKSRLISKEKPFHDPIKRNKVKLFKDSTVKNTIKTKDKETIIEVNRNILGKLLSITASSEHNIDFQKVLKYPLSPIPLSLAHPDGSRRTCTKSKLTEIITKHSLQHQPSIYTGENVGTYIMDLMATLRTFNAIPETCELLTWRLFDMLPKGLIRIDIVAGTYEGLSIKTTKRSSRGISRSIIIQLPKSKIPSPFSDILNNDKNKKRLIEIILEVMVNNRNEILQFIPSSELYFSTWKKCFKITRSYVLEDIILNSNQIEADTKIALHCNHALQNVSGLVVVRSPSGDVDIMIILLQLTSSLERVFLDYGTGKNRVSIKLSDVILPDIDKSCLIGFHAFTGNDFISSVFRRGKLQCWKTLQEEPNFQSSFSELGD